MANVCRAKGWPRRKARTREKRSRWPAILRPGIFIQHRLHHHPPIDTCRAPHDNMLCPPARYISRWVGCLTPEGGLSRETWRRLGGGRAEGRQLGPLGRLAGPPRTPCRPAYGRRASDVGWVGVQRMQTRGNTTAPPTPRVRQPICDTDGSRCRCG